MRSVRTLGVLLLAGSAVLVGCSDDDGGDATGSDATSTSASTTETTSTSTSEAESPTETSPGSTTGAGEAVDPPGPDECVTIQENADDVYPISGVGEIELRRGDGTLELVEARTEGSWQASGDQEDDRDEVEVELRDNGTELEFQAELHVDRLEIELCHDDDD